MFINPLANVVQELLDFIAGKADDKCKLANELELAN